MQTDIFPKELGAAIKACPKGAKKVDFNLYISKMSTNNLQHMIDISSTYEMKFNHGFFQLNGDKTIVCSGTYKDCGEQLINYHNSHPELVTFFKSGYHDHLLVECA